MAARPRYLLQLPYDDEDRFQPFPPSNYGSVGAYNNGVGRQIFPNGGSNGIVGAYHNSGRVEQNYANAKIGGDAYAGDGNGSHNWSNFGGSVVNNSGYTVGNGNGSIIHGNCDASNMGYYPYRRYY